MGEGTETHLVLSLLARLLLLSLELGKVDLHVVVAVRVHELWESTRGTNNARKRRRKHASAYIFPSIKHGVNTRLREIRS